MLRRTIRIDRDARKIVNWLDHIKRVFLIGQSINVHLYGPFQLVLYYFRYRVPLNFIIECSWSLKPTFTQ